MSDLTDLLASRRLTHLYALGEPAGASSAADAQGGPSGAASGVTFGAPGSGQTAADFGGTGSPTGGGSVTVGTTLTDEAGPHTVRASVHWAGGLAGGWYAAGSALGGYALGVTSAGLLCFPGPAGGGAGATYTTTVALTPGAWHDVAWDFDLATARQRWYLDGTLVWDVSRAYESVAVAQSVIGRDVDGSWPGRVQGVMVYDAGATPPPSSARRRVCG